jgi:hypothetical protein
VLVVCRTQSGFVGRAVAVGCRRGAGDQTQAAHLRSTTSRRVLTSDLWTKWHDGGQQQDGRERRGADTAGPQMLIFVSRPVVAGTYTFIKDWYDFSDCAAGCVGGIDVPAVEARRAASPLGVLFANLRACAMCRLVPLCHSLAGRHFPVDICC